MAVGYKWEAVALNKLSSKWSFRKMRIPARKGRWHNLKKWVSQIIQIRLSWRDNFYSNFSLPQIDSAFQWKEQSGPVAGEVIMLLQQFKYPSVGLKNKASLVQIVCNVFTRARVKITFGNFIPSLHFSVKLPYVSFFTYHKC